MTKRKYAVDDRVIVYRVSNETFHFDGVVTAIADEGIEVRPISKAVRDWVGDHYWIGKTHMEYAVKLRDDNGEPVPVGDVMAEMTEAGILPDPT